MSNLNNIDSSLDNKDTEESFDNVIAIIPAYNEENNIVNIINSVKKFVNFIIVVDDGSVDQTYQKTSSTGVKVIKNTQNRGKGFALKRRFQTCAKYNPDIVVTIDSDGQHDPEEIPRLIEPIKEGMADMVIGSR